MNKLSRRAAAERWIISLTPFLKVITTKVKNLKLGEPRVNVGPRLIPKEVPSGQDKIRRGAVWFIDARNVGFHVDFYKAGLHIEAWSGKDRRVSVWLAGEFTETTLKKDLNAALAAAGITPRQAVRDIVTGQQ